MDSAKYHITIRILHWSMALIILGLIAVGWYMTRLPDSPAKFALYPWHKSFGVLILLLVGLRIVARFTTFVPPLPATIPSWQQFLARISHLLLYAFMILIPITGYIMSMAGGHGVKFFGIPLPNLIGPDKPLGHFMRDLHGVFPYVLLAVIVLHVAGALKHEFFDRPENRVLRRMWFNKGVRS